MEDDEEDFLMTKLRLIAFFFFFFLFTYCMVLFKLCWICYDAYVISDRVTETFTKTTLIEPTT